MARGTSKFDKMFDSLIGKEATPKTDGKSHSRENRFCTTEVEEGIRRSLALFHAGRYAHCLSEARKLNLHAPDDPRLASLIGACNALVTGRLNTGIECCAEIIKRTFYIPDLYCTLGVLLLKSRRRGQAYEVFGKGLKIDPHHPVLQEHVNSMGQRRTPVLRFLPRAHPANRALGVLRARLSPA